MSAPSATEWDALVAVTKNAISMSSRVTAINEVALDQRDLARNLAARLEAENHEMLQALKAAQHMFDHSITGAAYQIIREAVATFGGQE